MNRIESAIKIPKSFIATITLTLGGSNMVNDDFRELSLTLEIGQKTETRKMQLSHFVDHGGTIHHSFAVHIRPDATFELDFTEPELTAIRCPTCGEEVYGFVKKEAR